MKKIIRGRRYDTETAKEIGSGSNGSRRDFGFWEETLYRKNTGEFFLHGEGGPASRYRESSGQNSWSGGEKIIPLSPEEARQWAEDHLDAETYEETFGVPEETTEKKVVTFSLALDVIEILKRTAAEKGVSISECLEEIVRSRKQPS